MALEMHTSLVMPAGVWFKEVWLLPEKITVTSLAEALGVTRQALTAVLSGRSAMTPVLAVKLEKATRISAKTLMNMQTDYELVKARAAERKNIIMPLVKKAPLMRNGTSPAAAIS